MKKILSLIILASLLTGCKTVKDETSALIEDTKKSYDNVVEEAKEIKDKTVETINNFENAAKEVKEATEAVKKLTN